MKMKKLLVVALAVMKFDFGPMKKFELNATKTGDLFAQEKKDEDEVNPKGKVAANVKPDYEIQSLTQLEALLESL